MREPVVACKSMSYYIKHDVCDVNYDPALLQLPSICGMLMMADKQRCTLPISPPLDLDHFDHLAALSRAHQQLLVVSCCMTNSLLSTTHDYSAWLRRLTQAWYQQALHPTRVSILDKPRG